MFDTGDSDFSYDHEILNHSNTLNKENKNDYVLDDDEPESDFLDSKFNYKIIYDEESEVDLKIDEQLLELAEQNKRDIYVEPGKLLRKIGILDPMGLEDNPLTGKPYQNLYYNPDLEWGSDFTFKNGMETKNKTYHGFAEDTWTKQPMYDQAEEMIKTIYDHQVILLMSGTGSGKTLLTPKFALHALNYKGRIAVTLPKIAPTDSAGAFAAACLDVVLGEHVSIKHSKAASNFKSETSNLVYQTDGSIITPLQGNDPLLYSYDCVIIDEAHERSTNIDTILLLLKDVCLQRPEFKLIIMSATINQDLFVNYFPKDKYKFTVFNAKCPPPKKITEYFLDDPIMKKMKLTGSSLIVKNDRVEGNPKNLNYGLDQATIVIEILKKFPLIEKDILVFVGGKGQFNKGQESLRQKLKKELPHLEDRIYICFLDANVVGEAQSLMVNGKYREIPNTNFKQAVIFATEVAESSITFNNLGFVIDSGINHKPKFFYEQDCYIQKPIGIAKSSHTQRIGRTGRTCDGIVFNLFTRDFYEKSFPDYAEFPIHTEDMTCFVMNILSDTQKINHIQFPFSYKYSDNNSLNSYLNKFIEPPKETSVNCMLKKMYALNIFEIKNGGLKRGYLTNLGIAISKLKNINNLCLRKMIILGYLYKCLPEILRFVSFVNSNECNIKDLFIEISSEKEKLKKLNKDEEAIELDKKLKRVVTKYTSKYGDIMSTINLLNEYFNKKEGQIDINTNRVISEPLDEDEFAYWCKVNLINTKVLNNIKKSKIKGVLTVDDLKRQFRNVINDFKELYPYQTFMEIMEPYKLLDTQDKEMNLLLTISDSCLSNIITLSNNNEYQTILFREQEIKKYLYFYKHVTSMVAGKLKEHYCNNDLEFYSFMYRHYRFLPKDLKIIKKKEVPPKKIMVGTGNLSPLFNRLGGDFLSFYNPIKNKPRFLCYLSFKAEMRGGSKHTYLIVSVLTPNIINILKSSTLEAINQNGLKRRIFLKANIPVNIVPPMIFSRKNKKQHLNQTKKKGGAIRAISRKKMNLKNDNKASLKFKNYHF